MVKNFEEDKESVFLGCLPEFVPVVTKDKSLSLSLLLSHHVLNECTVP